ncbi:MAG: hypothetical protein FJ096_08615 [Deltaproteobacteria bacterium]|nr:hypothetical protein [Deltaproteobacteria bacterium]
MKRATWMMVAGSLGLYALLPAACVVETTSGSGGAGGAAASTGVGQVSSSSAAVGPTSSVASTGSGSMNFDAACDAPAKSPSKGSCFKPKAPDCSDLNGGAGGGAPADCSKVAIKMEDDCTACVKGDCCDSLAACDAIPNCVKCFFREETDAKICGTMEITAATEKLFHCTECKCGAECLPQQCNPVTNEPCNSGAGEACDFGQDGFVCYPAPNDQKLCEECDAANGPWCEGGHTCGEDGGCAKYCCDDGDCGGGTCSKLDKLDVGICLKK